MTYLDVEFSRLASPFHLLSHYKELYIDMSLLIDTARNVIWRVRGHPLPPLVLHGHTGTIWSVAFLPDGRQVICGSDDSVRAWRIQDNDGVGSVIKEGGWVQAVAASSDGRWIATGGEEKTITVWNAMTYDKVIEWEAHSGVVWSLGFSPDSARLASGSKDGAVIIWDTTTGERLPGPLNGHTHWVRSVEFSPSPSPDEEKVASCDKHDIRIWHSHLGQLMVIPMPRHARSLAWTQDDRRIIAGCWDGSIRFFDASTGSPLAKLKGHTEVVESITVSRNGKFFASGSGDGTIRLWDTTTRQQIGPALQQDSYIFSVAISPDGSHLASGGLEKELRIWNLTGIIPLSVLANTLTASSDAPENVPDAELNSDSEEVRGVGVPPVLSNSDDPPANAQPRDIEGPTDNNKDGSVAGEDESEGVEPALQRRPSESSSLRNFLDRPAVAPTGRAGGPSDELYADFLERNSPDAPPPVDEQPKKRFSKFFKKFTRKKKELSVQTQPQPERQQAGAGAEVEPAIAPQPATTPNEITAKDKGKQKETDPDTAPAEDTDHASTQTPEPKPVTSAGHSKYVRNRVGRIRQASVRRPRQEQGFIAEARDRPVFAWETGPLPHEIERGCCFHAASYVCFGQRDPNVNPRENDPQPIAQLSQSNHGLAQSNSPGARLDRLLVRLHVIKPPPTSAPLPATVSSIPSHHADHNRPGASAPALVPPSNQFHPAIAVTSPTNTTEVLVHPSAYPTFSSQTPSPPAQALLSPATVDHPTIEADSAPSEMESNPWQHTDTEWVHQPVVEYLPEPRNPWCDYD
ncbi:WD40 repeat-like protein [Paxillus ammoniavirescens]|nr:WD40 repeat-like protein [Paxillus ammoniavirescens]